MPEPPYAATNAVALGPFTKWQRVEIKLSGPPSQGRGQPNPFSLFVNSVFTAPSGRQLRVPGFYDGDGRGGLDGNVWKIRFSADETGQWSFVTTSTNAALNGITGTFTVTATSADAPDLDRWGRWEAVGTARNRIRYLKFRDGPYWLKAGCDDPENFLGLYMPEGGEITAELPEGNDFLAAWWNPANGRNGQFQNEWRLRGGRQTLIPPGPGDWAARIVRQLEKSSAKAP